MKSAVQAIWILGSTIAATFGLLLWTPFESANRLLDRCFAGAPEWTQVKKLYIDPATQDVSHGENPSESLAALGNYWSKCRAETRIVFIGNSQMFYVSLAPGENASGDAEKSYPDLIAEHYGRSQKLMCYRLAAPGMSYTEALWYASYLALVPPLRPNAIVLQLNYQSFWNGGIRDGMLGMLDNPAFMARVEAMARVHQPYSDDFADAIRRYASRKDQERLSRQAPHESGVLAGPVVANKLESAARNALGSIPAWNRHSQQTEDFYNLLYSARVYLLGIKPSTARSVDSKRIMRSESALEAVGSLCRSKGIELLLFNAPVNPKVSLYRTAADLDRYRQFTSDLADTYHSRVYDLESAIPADLWGTWMGGPDPLHLGRRGHRIMSERMVRWLDSDLRGQ